MKNVFNCWSRAKETISRNILSRTELNGGFVNYEDNIHSRYQLISEWRLARQGYIK